MKPYYYSLSEYLKETYGCKMYKLSLSGGMTCPNRDGRIDTRGCIFCSAGGSGDFSGEALIGNSASLLAGGIATPQHTKIPGIAAQIEAEKALISRKYNGGQYIAYFQSYPNTYAPEDYLRQIFTEAIRHDDVRILSIATRPDCITPAIVTLLSELNAIKPVWVELGLQTIHENSARYIRRGYCLSVFDDAMKMLSDAGIETIVHMILGLPSESQEMMLQTADYIGHSGASGIKLQLLHVLSGTDLVHDYEEQLFTVMTEDEYFDCLGKILEILPPDMVIHRLTGDGAKKLLKAPLWSANKKQVMNRMNRYFKENNICQGRLYQ